MRALIHQERLDNHPMFDIGEHVDWIYCCSQDTPLKDQIPMLLPLVCDPEPAIRVYRRELLEGRPGFVESALRINKFIKQAYAQCDRTLRERLAHEKLSDLERSILERLLVREAA